MSNDQISADWPELERSGGEIDNAMTSASETQCVGHSVFIPLHGDVVAPVDLDIVQLEAGLLKLTDAQLAALGRLLPSQLCGEESAFQVFWREGYRLSDTQFHESQALAYRIAAEEAEHERLLQILRGWCPVPNDLTNILRRTRRFFRKVASQDLAIHFARIAALDSSVCVILSTLVKPISRAPVLAELFNRIRRDEARHVKFSRQHSCRLGGDRSLLEGVAIRVRAELVTLLYPLAHSFEDLGVDADRLFRRVARNASQPDC